MSDQYKSKQNTMTNMYTQLRHLFMRTPCESDGELNELLSVFKVLPSNTNFFDFICIFSFFSLKILCNF